MGVEIKYPVGEQSFKALRERECLYVDKTRFLERLLEKGSKYYFLARPRRFGKSLFLSMMKCFFEGRRELFTGLYADSMDWDWQPHPVLYLDLNQESYAKRESLSQVLENKLSEWEKFYGITPEIDNFSVRFESIIKTAYEKTGKGVVILVDEYDKPLVNNLHDEELFVSFREQLTTVYSNFKSSAEYIRLVFLTGVSRFALLSVFSGLNNITDISFTDAYSGICGISEKELVENFQPGMRAIAEKHGKTPEQVRDDLKKRYDGYHFSKRSEDIYNPYSLLNVMEEMEFGNFWIKSGIPTLLAQQLKKSGMDLGEVFNAQCFIEDLAGLDFETPRPIALLYQRGYLTIKGYDPESEVCTLGIPNNEVKAGFLNFLLPYYANFHGETSARFSVFKFVREFRSGDAEAVMQRLRSMFASIPYDMEMQCERNLHNALLMLMMLVGMEVRTELRTSSGRMDLFVKTDRYYYIIELKLNGSPRQALDQINDRRYALPFATDNREIIKIGVNFSSESRTIDGWEIERQGD